MLWAAASLWFFGFLRSGEVCTPGEKAVDKGAHLTMQDDHMDNLAKPTISASKDQSFKTDPFHQGVLVYIGHTNQPLCTVSALLAYMVRRGNRPGTLFFQDGRPLTRPCFIAEVRKLCWQLGLT